MASITNYGTLNYTIGAQAGNLTSNSVSTVLNVTYSGSMSKSCYESTFVPGDVLTYQIAVTNTGTGTLYTPVITDDLGTSGGITPLAYQNGSVSAYLYDGTTVTAVDVTVTAAPASVTFALDTAIPQGGYVILTYQALVSATLTASTVSIINLATFTASEGGIGGATLTLTATGSINRETVTMVKSVNNAQVDPGQTLTYTFTLTNIGEVEVDVNSLVDQLPANFGIADTITAQIGATPVTYAINTDYTVTAANLLTIDPAAASTPLTIPAAVGSTAGTTVITISGTITA